MIFRHIEDWDDAYANGPNIASGDRWPNAWVEPAANFRRDLEQAGRAKLDIAYGSGERNRLDLFMPEGEPVSLVVFVHGGYWRALDKSYWSHLAAGPLAHGFAVAMPSYTLCPTNSIAGITREIGAAISHAAELVSGPIRLTGHSAGGHLVARMVSASSPLSPALQQRIAHTVPISGLHDLRPLMRTQMNEAWRLDEAEAASESPVLLAPMEGARVTCWVGGNERAEFLRQSELLANIWVGLGARMAYVCEPDRHHFTVIDGLADPHHPLTEALIG
ncbi:alpha/beta hydrolase [Tianweitania sp. BSSL-BM11]|uniref:Alpha/beta hydrolase n=1 Tax=Tianweitania aestuarii TaxID=2814886 RepID=A0ABS5RYC0_9HYPH|nr:alpha/beta hydrolase [Tianweitania aestuarii]MBS9722035.1 alpha/beta hydrolase [Tianweitania aestuarii]